MFAPMSVAVIIGICDDPTPSTPGSVPSRSLSWSTSATVLASLYPLNCGAIENVIKFSVRNPRFCFLKFHKVRENSAPPVSNTRDRKSTRLNSSHTLSYTTLFRSQLRRNRKRNQVFRPQSQVLLPQIPQSPGKQRPARQQHQRKRHLPRHQVLPESHMPRPRGCR